MRDLSKGFCWALWEGKGLWGQHLEMFDVFGLYFILHIILKQNLRRLSQLFSSAGYFEFPPLTTALPIIIVQRYVYVIKFDFNHLRKGEMYRFYYPESSNNAVILVAVINQCCWLLCSSNFSN